MSIMVKDVNGTEQAVASNGKANAGLTLGIIGTALGALGSSVLGGIVGTEAANGCLVTEKQFYENELASRDREFANFQNLQLQICNLAQRVSINETANAYQNMLNDKQFECVDKQMDWDRIATTYQIQSATCKKIDGTLSLPLSALSNGFQANDNYLATYSVPYGINAYGSCGCGNGCGSWYY